MLPAIPTMCITLCSNDFYEDIVYKDLLDCIIRVFFKIITAKDTSVLFQYSFQ